MTEGVIELHITDADVTGGEALRLDLTGREAARGLLIDRSGKLLLMRVERLACFKLPGGGIEPGETPESALEREMLEETGYTINNAAQIAVIYEHKYQNGFSQKSFCFVSYAKELSKPPEPTEKEEFLGISPGKWTDAEAAVRIFDNLISECEDYSLLFMLHRERAIIRIARSLNIV